MTLTVFGITFLAPLFLLAGVVLAAVTAILDGKRKRYGVWLGQIPLMEKAGVDLRTFGLATTGVKALAVLGLCALLAQPVLTQHDVQTEKNGIDIAVVLDISKSMLAQDILPTRIERAKTEIAKFAQGRPNDRIGVVLFAGRPFVGMPITFDTDAITEFIRNAGTNSVAQSRYPELSGTAIGDGLLSAVHMLDSASGSEERKKVILLFTDGEENVKRTATAAQSAELAKESGIKIYAVGIGSEKGIPLFTLNENGDRQYFLQQDGTPLVVRVDMGLLKTIAERTGGKAYNAADTSAFTQVMEELSRLPKAPLKTVENVRFTPWEKPLLVFCTADLALLLAIFTIAAIGERRISGGRNYEVRKAARWGKRALAAGTATCLLLAWV